MTLEEHFSECRRIATQPLRVADEHWKRSHPGGRSVACYPVFAPAEVIHAAGMLPLGLFGGRRAGELHEVVLGDGHRFSSRPPCP